MAPQIVSFHYCRFPYQILGFSLMGFITFHSYVSARLVSLTLLQAVSVDHSLGNLASRQPWAAQAYRFTWHKHYIRLRMCEHGLSSGFPATE